MNLKDRLERVEYQILKQSPSNPNVTFSEENLINKVRDIYDAAINADNSLDFSDAILPLSVFGVSIEWSPNNTLMEASIGSFTVVDSLIDDIVKVPQDTSVVDLSFHVNDEVFMVNNDYFFQDTGWEQMVEQASSFDPQTIYNDFENDVTSLGLSFDSIADSITVHTDVGPSYALPLPTIHTSTSTDIFWTTEGDGSSGIHLMYMSTLMPGFPGSPDAYNNFIISSGADGSQGIYSDAIGNNEQITMNFTKGGQSYNKTYNIQWGSPQLGL